jgi:hypothetical protein
VTSDDDRDLPAQEQDPDRAAILARRRRFIAIAISGLATTACKASAQPCLSITQPEADTGEEPVDPDPNQPIVEEPGVPVETGETAEPAEPEAPLEPTPPEVCLKIAPQPQPQPQPCLKKSAPRPCLNIANQS